MNLSKGEAKLRHLEEKVALLLEKGRGKVIFLMMICLPLCQIPGIAIFLASENTSVPSTIAVSLSSNSYSELKLEEQQDPAQKKSGVDCLVQ